MSAQYVHLPGAAESIPIICVADTELDWRRVVAQIVLGVASSSVAIGPITRRHQPAVSSLS